MKPRRLYLRKDLSRHIRSGSPWIFAEALKAVDGAKGEVVDVCDLEGRFLARGVLDPASDIAVRVWSLDAEEPFKAVVARRFAVALALRKRLIDRDSTDGFRLLNGEGDHMPGVVVDLYGRTAVARFDGDGPAAFARAQVVAALQAEKELNLECIYERAGKRGMEGSGQVLFGTPPRGELEVREHGMKLLVDVVRGQKTGTFLDQRENRAMVRSVGKGVSRMLNLFSYTGGFTLAGALGGAKSSVSVDTAQAALDTARRILDLNAVAGDHTQLKADAFEYLRKAKPGEFDLIVVDPPNMAPSQSKLGGAIAAYLELNVAALHAVAKGGLIASASCSSHVDEPAFLAMLGDAVARSKRQVRIVTVRGAGADHPVAPGHPEGRYLKFVLMSVE